MTLVKLQYIDLQKKCHVKSTFNIIYQIEVVSHFFQLEGPLHIFCYIFLKNN